MTRNMSDRTDATKNDSAAAALGGLPNLSPNELRVAQGNTEWAGGLVEFYLPGMTHRMEDQGVVLQVVSKETVRIISVVDHIGSLTSAAMVKASFEEAGIDVETDPYMVLIPYDKLVEGNADEAAEGNDPLGMEVA